ncbi:acetate--CoA ligase [Prochlorococcus marinus XMU1411]|uniref:acetate--CoA ligase n=1 Tax=Prochlorococcus marinus TaxID=1219 RepID=UPI001AD9E2F4|nr:acetate--CoA ligase [Prochlorococcus marinus]MBO8243485.1 acetate--CoA ligase [Prochlorococcus marinus XMU1411]MBW3054600.1 acetate--CoA ligase [Prochlorococcus marinus str. MU1411]MCR8538178.1 acetate--CoA ligase [Prochlorococcus marinus CUG1430]
MSLDKKNSINNILEEKRIFPPSKKFAENSNISTQEELLSLKKQASDNPIQFWESFAKSELDWFEPFQTVLDNENAPFFKWFKEGKLNITYNCLDRHIKRGLGGKTALIWEGEPGDSKKYTYEELLKEVCKAANALKAIGVKKGDLVCIYMPMIPEAMFAMLACARIGAPHSVVFGGFSSEALKDRLIDGNARFVITADGGFRKDKVIELKKAVDAAIESGANKVVEKVVVVQRTQKNISMVDDRDFWWHELLKDQKDHCEPEIMNSEDRLFILYTSGSTGKPKGVVHTTGGYNLWSHLTFKWIFDLKDDDIYWCTADVGWITGHSYIVYGPLSNGATTLMYEGVPRPSNLGAFWEIVQKYKVSIFYTAPTAIRAFMKSGREIPDKYNLESLRLLGTVGEPINPEAWMWYKDVIGKDKCPIVDTWWQTETGGVMISPLPGVVATKPGSATFPLPGIEVEIVDKNGDKVKENEGGYLIIKKPWPGMMRTIHANPERYLESYWEYISFKGEKNVYFAGDGARIDEDGYIWIMGRVDDVISVSGHRLGTMEIESALVSHKSVAESAVVGKKDDLKGEVIVAFVSLEKDVNGSSELVDNLKKHVVNEIGIIAKPEKIIISDSLPKTRSGKIMRRILRSLAAGEKISGDISTLEDSSVLEKLKELS